MFNGKTNKFDGTKTGKLGSEKHPAQLRVQTKERQKELTKMCQEKGWKCEIKLDPKQPEDINDLEILQNPVKTVHAEKKVGRNEPCSCGSGKKYKYCHGK